MGIASSIGLISGLDTESIITSMMNLERAPISGLQQQQSYYQSKISSYGIVKSVLSGLQTSLSSLKDTDTFAPGYSASSSNKDIVSVSVSDTDTASAGSYSLKVNNLATSAQMTSFSFTESDSTVGPGMIQFQVGDGERQSIAIDSDNQSLEDIATLINESDADVSASVLRVAENDYRLTLTANDTGKDISYTYQEEGFTFETTTQASDSTGEVMTSEAFASDSSALGLTGTLSVNGNDIALTGTETLNDIQASVDALAGVSAQVTYDSEAGTYSLEVENDTAGGAVELNFSDSDAGTGLSGLMDSGAYVAAEKAEIVINNITVERESNTIDDLINGLTLNLNAEDSAETLNISIKENYDTAKTSLSSFVDAFNNVVSTLDKYQSYSAETKTGGNLLGDGTTNVLRSGLRRMMFSSVDGISSSVNSLSRLGIEVEESGQLSFNSDTFDTAMGSDKDDVTTFFTSEEDGNSGFAVNFDSFINGYVQSDGILDAKIDGYTNSSDRIDTTIERIEIRLEKRESNLRKQFQNLEQVLSTYSSTASYLSSQLSSISNLTNQINNS